MDIIAQAVAILRRDGLIVYPTETVYGLGADALSEHAVYKVYEAKCRPLSKPISIAVCDLDMLHSVAIVTPQAEALIDRFLPGPVTLILKAKSILPSILSGGTGMIGIRIPANDIALDIIRSFDAPITATSANISDEKEPVTREEVHVPHDLFIQGTILSGVPSTVVDIGRHLILRRGNLHLEIERFLATIR